jgi:hypothetical protein
MIRHEKILTKPDGSQVKIVVLLCCDILSGIWAKDIFILLRETGSQRWASVPEPPYPERKSLGGMSADEYTQHGRRGMMAHVRPHDIIKAQLELDARIESGEFAN